MRHLVVILLLLGACDKAPAKTAPVVNSIAAFDLPLSKTSTAVPAPNAVEIVIPLSQGKAGSPVSVSVTKGQAVKLRIHALIPYQATATVLRQLERQEVGQIWIAVRHPSGNPPKEGWMELSGYRTVDPKIPKVDLETASILWEDFVAQWSDLYEVCRTSSQDCSAEPEKAPQGGSLQIVLVATEHGARVAFQQIDAPSPVKKQRVQVMDFDNANDDPQFITSSSGGKTADLGAEALFTFRSSASLADTSPITELIQPICASKPCTIRIRADDSTSTGRVMSLLGAATAKSIHKPVLAFDAPL